MAEVSEGTSWLWRIIPRSVNSGLLLGSAGLYTRCRSLISARTGDTTAAATNGSTDRRILVDGSWPSYTRTAGSDRLWFLPTLMSSDEELCPEAYLHALRRLAPQPQHISDISTRQARFLNALATILVSNGTCEGYAVTFKPPSLSGPLTLFIARNCRTPGDQRTLSSHCQASVCYFRKVRQLTIFSCPRCCRKRCF